MAEPPVLVQLDVLGVVDGVELEGVEGDEDGADVGVDVAGDEARAEIVEERLLVEVGQLAQVRVLPVFRLVEEAVEVVLD